MGSDADREPFHNGAVVHHNHECVCEVFQDIYVYRNSNCASCGLCRQPTEQIGKSFIKAYAAVCLEGAIILLACIIFSVFAASPPAVDADAAPVTMVWGYVGELIFNMLVLVGAVKMADRIVKEMMFS